MGCQCLTPNSKVAYLMVSLSLYGILLIVVSNHNIDPLYLITNFRNHYLSTNTSRLNVSESPATSRENSSVTTNVTGKPPVVATIILTNHSRPALPNSPLLTLFTTFKNSPGKAHLYENTIRNWELLRPWVRSILFTIPGEPGVADFARNHGWIVLPVPKKSAAKVPILRHMFLEVQSKYNSSLYGYANGDILFDKRLVDTLTAILPSVMKMKQVLIVGRRTNVKLPPKHEIKTLEDVKKLGSKGQLFGTNAQDYFISKSHGYPWESIPNFVVGRVGYDNWLVVTALVKKMFTIDLTKTVLALHQTDTDGNFAGHRKKTTGDTYVNYGLAGKRFDYSLGHVTCGQFYTDYQEGKPKLLQRSKNGCERMFKRMRLNPYVPLPRRRRRR